MAFKKNDIKLPGEIVGLITAFINTQMVSVMTWTSNKFEKHDTLSRSNISLGFKLTTAKFINSSVLLVAANMNAEYWFDDDNLI